MIRMVSGGVCAPRGFQANGIHCGIRKNKTKRDLALIVSDCRASAAAVYTTNLVKGAPILVTKAHLADGYAQAMICNSGNANTCNADGLKIAEKMSALVEQAAGIASADVIVASTGVIGQPLNIEPIAAGMEELSAGLCGGAEGSGRAAEAIMTTDTVAKEVACTFEVGGKSCTLGGIAKGSGMIHPNMATMLVFLTTDAAISPQMLQKAIRSDIEDSFHMMSVDGDTSTNDMLSILANGRAGNEPITEEGADYEAFCAGLRAVTHELCRMMAKDGEGATRLIECHVDGAADLGTARTVAKSIICSTLFKSAVYGADANWGRVLCAIGYSGARVDVTKIDVDFASAAGRIGVCRAGSGIPFSEEQAKKVLTADEVQVLIDLHDGDTGAVAWGCDLTYDYVKINADYRT
ncbi:MAG: bifunctional ornithine acetyltransferase/N-acetylglutamate synthase [Lachnospiraceae bacterium]|nr:bifunctional ornithine acetyltransferase/N-acetylglutamate synthase [Lachnospiraceae bacterium]